MGPPVNLLEVEGLTKGFTLHALGKRIEGCRDVSFTVGPGEFVGITGRSGSGKSTVLKLLYRTYLPQQGVMRYASECLGRGRSVRSVGPPGARIAPAGTGLYQPVFGE